MERTRLWRTGCEERKTPALLKTNAGSSLNTTLSSIWEILLGLEPLDEQVLLQQQMLYKSRTRCTVATKTSLGTPVVFQHESDYTLCCKPKGVGMTPDGTYSQCLGLRLLIYKREVPWALLQLRVLRPG